VTQNKGRFLLGIDESGTGAWAGPFHVAGTVFPYHQTLEGVIDSKKLTDKRRRELVPIITEAAVDCIVGIVQPETIAEKKQGPAWQDQIIEITNTMLFVLEKTHGIVYGRVDVMIDGSENRALRKRIQEEVKGGLRVSFEPQADEKYLAVSAASILAKTYRNDYMIELHRKFPEYGWAKNAGYGTEEHARALVQFGRSPHHRPLTKKWDLSDRVAH
jgi:ribonuclease HII